jgi:hypothetical protein
MEKKRPAREETKQRWFSLAEEWLHNGNQGTKAYQKIYPKAGLSTAQQNSFKILHEPIVQEYIRERKIEIAKEAELRHGVTRLTIIDDQLKKKKALEKVFDLAQKEVLSEKEEALLKRMSNVIRTADVNKADEILIKLLGLYEAEKIDITTDGEKVRNVFMIGGKEVEF